MAPKSARSRCQIETGVAEPGSCIAFQWLPLRQVGPYSGVYPSPTLLQACACVGEEKGKIQKKNEKRLGSGAVQHCDLGLGTEPLGTATHARAMPCTDEQRHVTVALSTR